MMEFFEEIQPGDRIRIEDVSAIMRGDCLTEGEVYTVIGKELETADYYAFIAVIDDENDFFPILLSELHAVSKVM